MTTNPGPLRSITVCDLSRILAGPTCTQLLGDLGADVIKIEKPGAGDDTRAWGPPYVKDGGGADTTESAYYLSTNRNKRSVTIDFTTPEGADLVRRLLTRCDVLIENFKLGGLARHGLGYEQLKSEFPGLVYCSITGFGQTGPKAHRPGYDFLIQGMGGIMALTGEPEGRPMKVGVGIADVMCGMYATVAILSALHERAASGQGQHIDVALLDSQVAWLINGALNYLTSGSRPRRHGNAHPNIVPYEVFPSADGHFILAVGNDRQFGQFCELAGVPGLAVEERFATNAARVRNREELVPLLAEVTRQRPTAEWLAGLESRGVPCGPVNQVDEVFEDEQVRHRGMKIAMPHPCSGTGTVDLIGNPLKLSETPVSYRHTPPTLGQHTDQVLTDWLGLDTADLADLRRRGII